MANKIENGILLYSICLRLIQNAIGNKESYSSFVERNSLPIFFQPWYLDAVSVPYEWDAVVVSNEGGVTAVWPFLKKSKFGCSILTHPPLTPYLGPYIKGKLHHQKGYSRLQFEKQILHRLADELPGSVLHLTHGRPEWYNWQPLVWKGFVQSTRYTYRIDLTQPLDLIWENISTKTRSSIRKAERSMDVVQEKEWHEILVLIEKSFERKRMKVPYGKEVLQNLNSALTQRNSRISFSAKLANKNVANTFVAFDNHTAYLLATGRADDDPGGSMALLIWESIKESKAIGLDTFDFEGSMIESIERFFRSFGGTQSNYNRLIRTKNRWWRLLFTALNRI